MWDLQGASYPASYRKIVYKMYTSNDEIDQVMALLATAALSKQMAAIENNYAPALKYQVIESQCF